MLHYPWEQGSTANTSLLAQIPALSPDAPANLPAANIVGGWAGTSLGEAIPAHAYIATNRPLDSSPSDRYTGSFWIRPTSIAASANLISNNAGTASGFKLSVVSGPAIRLEMFEGGMTFGNQTALAIDRWTSVALRTTGVGMQVFVNGQLRFSVTPPSSNGFSPAQAANLTVGASTDLDLDDLRFYNIALTDAEMCTLAARGHVDLASGQCVAFAPGLEVDMENGRATHTGYFAMLLGAPQITPAFPATKLGFGLRLTQTQPPWGYMAGGLRNAVANLPGRSFAFWFEANAAANGKLWDSTFDCGIAAQRFCGIRLSYASGLLSVFTNPNNLQAGTTTTIPVPAGTNNVVVTEQRSGSVTLSLRVYINGGAPTVINIVGSGDIYAGGGDTVVLVDAANQVVDEYEFWGADLSTSPELLCEHGFDGEFDPATGICALTSN